MKKRGMSHIQALPPQLGGFFSRGLGRVERKCMVAGVSEQFLKGTSCGRGRGLPLTSGGIIGPTHHLISDTRCMTLNDLEMNSYFTLNSGLHCRCKMF